MLNRDERVRRLQKRKFKYYHENQARNILKKHVGYPPSWFLLGGPGDGNEAQNVVQQWRGVKVLATDPNPEVLRWQKEDGGFPKSAILLEYALSDVVGDKIKFVRQDGFLVTGHVSNAWDKESETLLEVETTTLDHLETVYGPFEKVILWLDIEGMEAKALHGAHGLFERGAIDLLNVEVRGDEDKNTSEVKKFLAEFNFQPIKTWNDQRTHRDILYKRSGYATPVP